MLTNFQTFTFFLACRLPKIYEEFYHTVNNADHEKDLRWWSNTYGVNMPMNWPQFEVDQQPILSFFRFSNACFFLDVLNFFNCLSRFKICTFANNIFLQFQLNQLGVPILGYFLDFFLIIFLFFCKKFSAKPCWDIQ